MRKNKSFIGEKFGKAPTPFIVTFRCVLRKNRSTRPQPGDGCGECIKDEVFLFRCDQDGFPPCFFRIGIFGSLLVSSMEFAGLLRRDVLHFGDPVDGSFLGIDFFDDPPHLPLIQLPHWS